jgi:prophage regulatory protein
MRYLTMKQLRQMLGGRGRTSIYRDIAAGRLPVPVKIGGSNYFSECAVCAAIEKLSNSQDEEV